MEDRALLTNLVELGTNDLRISDIGTNGDATTGAAAPDVAFNATDNEYLVVFDADDSNGESEIYGQFITAAGAEIGTNDFQISNQGPANDTDFDAVDPKVAWNSADNEFLVVWRGDTATAGEDEIFGTILNADGSTAVSVFQISQVGTANNASQDAVDPEVVYNATDNEFLVVWSADHQPADELEIYGQRISAAGAEVGTNDFRISTQGTDGDTSVEAIDPIVAWNSQDNEYLVTWTTVTGGGSSIFGQLLTNTGGDSGSDFAISAQTNAEASDVVHNPVSNQYLVVYHAERVSGEFEIYGQRLTAAGAKTGTNDFRISSQNPNNVSIDANDPSVVFGSVDNEFLVAWHGDTSTAGEDEVFVQQLEADGSLIEGNQRISAVGPDNDINFTARFARPAFNSADDEYVVTFVADNNAGGQVDDENEIFVQRLGDLSLVVDTIVDESDGDFSTGDLSLREAIELANANGGADTITFSASSVGGAVNFHDATPDTITLGGTQLTISSDITITGPGADLLTVSGNDSSRVFNIASGDHDVTFDSLTVAKGDSGRGGGIRNQSSGLITITRSVLTDSVASSHGGSIYHENGELIVQDSTISDSSANPGGGLSLTASATASIVNSTISGNRALGTFGGFGGGIHSQGVLTITNSTVTGNRSSYPGFGIANSSNDPVTITNSIVSGNFLGEASTSSSSNNLIGEIASASSNNLIGEMVAEILDTTLRDNGGSTPTHALVAGSPAIDAGDNALAKDADDDALTTDQRGTGFDRIIGGTVDIGAFEAGPPATATVNLSVDANSGTEAAASVITVTATADAAVSGDQTVDVTVTGTGITAGDYILSNTTITIPDGMTTGSVTFTVQDDSDLEGAETTTLTISSPSAGIVLGATTTQNVEITDNDTASLSINNVIGLEGTDFRFRVTLDNAVPGPFTVNVNFTDGSATGGADFDNTPVTLNFAGNAGERHDVIVPTTDDAVGMEFIEDFTVTLTASNPLIDDSATGTGSIDDVDMPLPDRTTGLTASNTSGVRPTLEWDAATNATSYSVYVLNSATGEVANLSYIFDTQLTLDMDLPAGSYRFLVKSVNGAGNGGWSDPFDFTLGMPVVAPMAPTGLTAINTNTPQPTLQWAATAGATSYTIYFQNLAGGVVAHQANLSTTQYVQMSDLPAGSYRFLVKAANAGGSSGWSAPYDFTVGMPIAAPMAPTGLTAINTNTPQPTLQWSPSAGATSYTIYFHRPGGDVILHASNLSGTEFVQMSDLPDGNYRFLLKASNAGGTSGWSAPFDFTVGAAAQTASAAADDQKQTASFNLMNSLMEEIAIAGITA